MTGAGGMLGRDVVAAAERAGHEVTGLARADLDVSDAGAVRAAFESERPDVVVNCAAYTNVDGAEEDEGAATELNGRAAGHVAEAAAAVGASVVQPSTDYVFDGSKRTPYVESDPTGPIRLRALEARRRARRRGARTSATSWCAPRGSSASPARTSWTRCSASGATATS